MTTTTQTPGHGPATPGTPTAPAAASGGGQERRRWLMLAVLITGQFMALLDVTIVNVAIPTIHARLHASGAALQLIVAGYTITYAMGLITSARLGDLRGHRKLFLAGIGTFTLASLACGLAPNAGALIAARLVQGVGAAMMVPQILSVIQRHFTGAARTRALGVYTATLASGAVIGQVLGGVLVSANLLGASWRPVFLVNVPVGVAAALLVPRLVPADHVPGGRRLDLVGLATAATAVLLLVVPLVLGHEEGWPAWTWASLAAGTLLAAVFLLVERSVAAGGGDPLLNLRVLAAPGLAAGLVALTAAMVAYGGFLFAMALHLQLGLGDSALRAGLTFAPGAAAFGATGYWWRRLPSRVHHALVPAGFAVGSLAYLGLAADLHAGTRGGLWLFALLVGYGIGMGAAFSPLVTQALVAVPRAEAADASGLLTTTIQLSQVIGVAVFGSLFLSLAAHPGVHASASAFSTVDTWLAALTLLGIVGALLLARTVRAASRAPAG
jgi:MFS family permease